MIKPPPPPTIPSAQERREAFNNWLYQFWSWAGNGGAGTAQISGTSPIVVTTGTGTFAISHATSGVIGGTYGDATIIPRFGVDARGHLTLATNAGTLGTFASFNSLVGAGDVLGTSTTGTFTGALSTTGVTAGTYGDGTAVSQVVVDAKGRVTSAASVAITYPSDRALEGVAPIAVGTAAGTYSISHNTSGVVAGTFGGVAGIPRFDISVLGHVLEGTNITLLGVSPLIITTGTTTAGVGTSVSFSHSTSGVAAGTYGGTLGVARFGVSAEG